MKAILLSLFCFFGITAFSQNAKASVQQRISLKLMDMAIVEKKPAAAANSTATPAVQIQSASQWTVRAKEVDVQDEAIAAAGDRNSAAIEDASTMVYTVSKL